MTKLQTVYFEQNPIYKDTSYRTKMKLALPNLIQIDATPCRWNKWELIRKKYNCIFLSSILQCILYYYLATILNQNIFIHSSLVNFSPFCSSGEKFTLVQNKAVYKWLWYKTVKLFTKHDGKMSRPGIS